MVGAPENRKSRRHETKALLRAHLSAAARHGHSTRHCPVCHRLHRLALEGPPEAFETASSNGLGTPLITTASPRSIRATLPALPAREASTPVAP